MAPSSPSLLSHVSVLDLSIWRPGPYATSLLVGLGADVVKVEPPGGDPMRHYPELFESVNAGKRSIMLDLKEPDGAGRRRALDLAGRGRCHRRRLPPGGDGPARAGRGRGPGPELWCRVLLHLGLRAARSAGRGAGTRPQLPGVGRSAGARRWCRRHAATAPGRSGLRYDGSLRHLRRAARSRGRRAGDVSRYLDDRRHGHLDRLGQFGVG